MNDKRTRIPVILDTDIGIDIDDTWALAMLLKCPELDLKLAVSATGDTLARAKIIAKMLDIAGRSDIPVGVGVSGTEAELPQAPWVANYDPDAYGGEILQDGVGAMIRTIMDSPEPITLVCIGPLPNIAAALERDPRIAAKTRFVGMQGSIYRGYHGKEAPVAEYNVKAAIPAAQRVFTAKWMDMTITPLDTCERIRLSGERYRRVQESSDPVVQALMANYRIWAKSMTHADPDKASTTLFDAVAIYLALSTELLVMKRLGLRVTDEGFTVPDDTAPQLNAAIEWKDLDAFEEFLTRRLLSEVVR